MDIIGIIAEHAIQKAQQDGLFDHLPGEGKPLNLLQNPYIPDGWQLTFDLLKNNHFSLPWIESWRDLRKEINSLRGELSSARLHCADAAEWQREVTRFTAVIQRLNRKIFNYNIQAPSLRFHQTLLNPSRELAEDSLGQPIQQDPGEP